jgi:hypothetical protein
MYEKLSELPACSPLFKRLGSGLDGGMNLEAKK